MSILLGGGVARGKFDMVGLCEVMDGSDVCYTERRGTGNIRCRNDYQGQKAKKILRPQGLAVLSRGVWDLSVSEFL